jgi:capsular exopolysaccharide synthesis family protein
MVKINNSIESATRRLNDEMAKIVSGVENDFRTADAKESSLDRALEEQKREVLRLNQASIGYATLQRDASSTQQMFQTVLQRMKEMDLAAELQSNNARILDHAEVPTVPIWPRTRLNLVIAFFGGLFVAMMTALGLDYLKPRIAIPSDIPGLLNLPLLGVTPRIRGLKQRIAHHDLPVAFQEALRDIRTQLFLSPIRGAARSLTVTSTASGEGKTMVATNLAMSIAMTGRRVLLVDADMRRPQVHNIFTGISRSPGLSDVMQGKQKPMDVLVDGPVKGLVLMPAGVPVANPTDLLDSGRLSHLVQGFSHVFDTVILDCPPIQGVADAAIVANTTASVLFVIGSGRTSPEAAQAALERMAAIQAQVVGVVLNKAQLDPRESYGYAQPEIVR